MFLGVFPKFRNFQGLPNARIPVLLLGLGLSLAGVGCGVGEGKKTKNIEPDQQSHRTSEGTAETDPQGSVKAIVLDRHVPVETFLIGRQGAAPRLLKAESLTLHFRSNTSPAQWDCRIHTGRSTAHTSLDATPWKSCDGNADQEVEAAEWVAQSLGPQTLSLKISPLQHRRAYRLQVRSRSEAGRVDATPISLVFVVDQIRGDVWPSRSAEGDTAGVGGDSDSGGATDEISGHAPRSTLGGRETLEKIAVINDSSTRNGPVNRTVQIGGTWGLVVPETGTVTSYSTDYTMNGGLYLIRKRGDHQGSAYGGGSTSCREPLEVRVDLGSRGLYCEATPSKDQWHSAVSRVLPYNHLELVISPAGASSNASTSSTRGRWRSRRSAGQAPATKVFVATFEGAYGDDPGEERVGVRSLCQNSSLGGTSAMDALHFQDKGVRTELLEWCQVSDATGQVWWVGSAVLHTTFYSANHDGQRPVRARVIFTTPASPSVMSGTQFSAKVGRDLQQILVPLEI